MSGKAVMAVLIIFMVLFTLPIGYLSYSGFNKRKILLEDEKNESLYCPFYTCIKSDEGKCLNSPWRCADGSDTCVGENKICMKLHGGN